MAPYSDYERKFLISMHAIAFAIHLLSSIFSFVKASELTSLNANMTFTKYSYTANSPPYTIPVSQLVGSTQNPIEWVAWNETITWLAHVVAVIIIRSNSVFGVSPRVAESARRWFSYAITAGLLQAALVLSLGPVPFFLIVYIMVNNAVVQILGGFMVDQEESIKRRVVFLLIGSLLFLASAVYIATSCLSIEGLNTGNLTITYEGLAITYILFYISFAIVQITRQCYKRGPICAYLHADGVFVLLSITSKVVLSWSMISIVAVGSESLGIFETSEDWPGIQLGIVIAASIVLIAGLVFNRWYFKSGVEYNILGQTEKSPNMVRRNTNAISGTINF